MTTWKGMDEEVNSCFTGPNDSAEWSSIEAAIRRAQAHAWLAGATTDLRPQVPRCAVAVLQMHANAIEAGEVEP